MSVHGNMSSIPNQFLSSSSDKRARSLQRWLWATLCLGVLLPCLLLLWLLTFVVDYAERWTQDPVLVQTLSRTSDLLKQHKDKGPQPNAVYKDLFEDVHMLQQMHQQDVVSTFFSSIQKAIAYSALLILLLAIVVVIMMQKKIKYIYRQTAQELATEIKRNQALIESRYWQQMARMLAHEIHNPLQPIQLMVQSLRKQFAVATSEDFAKNLAQTESIVLQEVAHLQSLVERFSDFAKDVKLQTKVCRMHDVLTKLFAKASQQWPDLAFELSSNMEDVLVLLDETLFQQVLSNLIKNAVQANPKQRLAFAFKIEQKDMQVIVEMTNTGVPIAADVAPLIFKPYFSTKANRNNMGLGLAIVHKIILQHQGSITYQTRNMQPLFVMTLPKYDMRDLDA
ncbi:MAG: HAMP domain-containing sensor histidine kinase [Bdellovibrionota bacterium]